MNKYIKSPINYIGCKHKLLTSILPLFPQNIDTFVDLFCGSGTIGLNVKSDKHVYNDINYKVLEILKTISEDDVDKILDDIEYIIDKYKLSKTNEDGFIELRKEYNIYRQGSVMLYTLMCYSFNYQCRFNNKGEYNSSFGRNRSQFSSRQCDNLQECSNVLKGQNCTFSSYDFSEFDYSKLSENDFVYIDPPYLSTTGSYNDGRRMFGNYTEQKEYELYDVMAKLNRLHIKFAVSNNFSVNSSIKDFVEQNGYKVHHLYADYSNCNYQKKDKNSKDDEVLIVNY